MELHDPTKQLTPVVNIIYIYLRYRYGTTFAFRAASFLPASALDAAKQQTGSQLADGSTVLIKGDRVYSSLGQLVSITDYAKGVITVLDSKTRRFATLPLAEYPAKILAAQKRPPMSPDAQRIFDNMKLDVKSSKTGQTATIHEIRTEENLLVVSMELSAGTLMRTEIHNWIAASDELQRRPDLRELAAYTGKPKGGLDPMELATKSLLAMPGIGEKLRAPIEEMKKSGGAVIRMRSATYMPLMPGAQSTGEPITELSMEWAEISATAVPDSRFEVPAGYQAAPMEDLLGPLFPAFPPTAAPVPVR